LSAENPEIFRVTIPSSVEEESVGTWVCVSPPHRHKSIVAVVMRIKNARAFIKVVQS
jgi:hypothetical protein